MVGAFFIKKPNFAGFLFAGAFRSVSSSNLQVRDNHLMWVAKGGHIVFIYNNI